VRASTKEQTLVMRKGGRKLQPVCHCLGEGNRLISFDVLCS